MPTKFIVTETGDIILITETGDIELITEDSVDDVTGVIDATLPALICSAIGTTEIGRIGAFFRYSAQPTIKPKPIKGKASIELGSVSCDAIGKIVPILNVHGTIGIGIYAVRVYAQGSTSLDGFLRREDDMLIETLAAIGD